MCSVQPKTRIPWVIEEKENVRGKFMVMQHISDECIRNPAFSSFFHLLHSQEKVMNSSLTKDALRHCVPKSGALYLVWDETRKNGQRRCSTITAEQVFPKS